MLQKTRGIVLHSIKYGESGLIIELFTENFGRQSYMIHGIRKKKSKVNAYLFHPMTLLDIDADYKEGRNLQKIKEVKSSYVINQIYFDIRRSTIAMFIGEILYRNIRETEPNKNLFDFLFHSVQLLDIAEKGIENFPIIFLLQLTKFIGIYPNTNLEINHNKAQSELSFYYLLNYSLSEIGVINIDASKRQSFLESIINYYRIHLAGTGQIQSLKVLREVFH
jgi:DNA repair protein RecO (recombination protein O)